MKKIYSFILIVFSIMAFAKSFAIAEKDASIDHPHLSDARLIIESKLPSSMTIIEDEAFEGTALVKVDLPDGVISIGDKAFANTSPLINIRIPLSTKIIASTAFENSNNLTISAPVNSLARAFARTHGLRFSPMVMFCVLANMTNIYTITKNRETEITDTETDPEIKSERHLRRFKDINVVYTEELIANHIQERAPPMA